MSRLKETQQVIYVEPNIMDETTSYQAGGGLQVNKTPDLEDMCIAVDLEVELKGRTYSSTNSNSDTIKMTWQSSHNGEKVGFMRGSKVYVDKAKTKYFNNLTTNYTDIFLTDITGAEPTNEMFGIKSIDIQYNNFMVPQVTIVFTDVRGVSLFAREELRHNIVSNGVTSSANNDIEGSFFKCFFTFPYPKFTLRVKGFYGQVAAYELTCSDFRAVFDSNTGSFEVTAQFTGYAFSFLGDVMVNQIVAAPYSNYIGAQYWEDNCNNGRFYVLGKNGSKVPMIKLGVLINKLKNVQQEVNDKLSEENIQNTISTALGDDSKGQQAIDSSISPIRTKYNSYIQQLQEFADSGLKKDSNKAIARRDRTDASFYFVTDDEEEIEKIKEFAKEFNEIKKYIETCGALQAKLIKARQNNANWNLKAGDAGSDGVDSKLFGNCISLGAMFMDDKSERKDAWNDYINSKLFIFFDCGLYAMLNELQNISPLPTEEMQKVELHVYNEAFEKIFNFPPSVENITKIIMAHFETYVHMISQCASDIINDGTKRSLNSLGMSIETFPDVKNNQTNSDAGNVIIPPFPEVTRNVTLNGVEKREDAWIGEIANGDRNKFREIALVEGLLSAVNSAATDINVAFNGSNYEYQESKMCSVKNPLTYMDMFMTGSDNPFGKMDLSDIDSVAGHLIVRALNVFNSLGDKIDATSAGMYDAENFKSFYKNDVSINTLIEKLDGNALTADNIIDFGLGNATLSGGKSYPWKGMFLSDKYSLLSKYDDSLSLSLGLCPTSVVYYEGRTLPVKNWTWNEWAKHSKMATGVGYNCENYIVTYSPYYKGKQIIYTQSPLFFYTNGNLAYFKSTYDSIPEDIQDRFEEFSQEDFSLQKVISSNRRFTYSLNNQQERYSKSILDYDYDGYAQNIDSLEVIAFFGLSETEKWPRDEYASVSLFGNEKYYEADDDLLKAYYFIMYSTGGNLNQLAYNFTTEGMLFLDKLNILQYAAAVWYADTYPNNTPTKNLRILKDKIAKLRYDHKAHLIKIFKDWAACDLFKQIRKDYELSSSERTSLKEYLTNATSGTSGERSYNAINCCIDGSRKAAVHKAYKFIKLCDEGLVLINNNDIDTMPASLNELKKEWTRMCSICFSTPFNNKREYGPANAPKTITVSTGDMKAYLDAFLKELKNSLSKTNTIVVDGLNNDPDDFKVGVYNYIKLLYDKWIASDLNNSNYTMEELFYSDNPYFQFIDSMYNRVGNSIYLNLQSFANKLISCQTQNGYTLLSLLGDVYSENKFVLLCIQNFMDLSNSESMKSIFKPVPYMEANGDVSHPNFVVLYSYEASAHLDVEGGDYQDDSFYLNDATTWPKMITQKQPGDLKIPAFGVSYGSMYQSYFKNVQVDMNSPMVTEQSMKAKFLVAGANAGGDNTGTRHITVGQDLYTIYANNSYTCTITMMGCAFIQPMMYFVLLNVPMFRGSYMIVKVKHTIEPGNMTTTFTGVRMASTATRSVRNWLVGAINESSNGLPSPEKQFEAKQANIANNCNYAYYPPISEGVGEDFSEDLDTLARENMSEDQIKNLDTKYPSINNATLGKVLGAIAAQEFNPTISEAAKTQCAAVIACMYNYRGCFGKSAYKNQIFKSGWRYFMGVEAYEKSLNNLLNTNPEQCAAGESLVREIFKSGPYHLLVGKKNLQGGLVTQEQVQKGFITVGTSDSSDAANLLASYGTPLYETEHVGKYYHVIYSNNSNDCKNGFKPNVKANNDDIEDVIDGLIESIIKTLKATETYNNADVSYSIYTNNIIEFYTNGTDYTVLAAIFDIILSTYNKWIDKLYWVCENVQTTDNPTLVAFHVKKGSTELKVAYSSVSNQGEEKADVYIKSKDEIANNLKLSLIKRCKAVGYTSPSKLKSEFVSINSMPDDEVISTFELDNNQTSSITNCNSLIGYPNETSGLIIGNGGTIKNGYINDWNVQKSVNWLLNNTKTKSQSCSYNGCRLCATYVKRAMAQGGFYNIPSGDGGHNYRVLQTIGWVAIENGTHNKGDNTDFHFNQPLQIGDICTILPDNTKHNYGHICMYCGTENGWISDFKQCKASVYSSDSNQTWVLLRYNGHCCKEGSFDRLGKSC